MPTDDEYRTMAADALAKLPVAKNEAERVHLRRANAAYLKLASHRNEAAARAELKPARIKPEKPAEPKGDPRRAVPLFGLK